MKFLINTWTQRAMVDLVIAVLSLLLSYYLSQSVWPFIPTVLGFVGLVYLIFFLIEVIKFIMQKLLKHKGRAQQ